MVWQEKRRNIIETRTHNKKWEVVEFPLSFPHAKTEKQYENLKISGGTHKQ
jgi:hypothetical protein